MERKTMSTPTLPPPPRRVRGLISGGGGVWFGRIFSLPHTLVGLGAFGYWLFLVFYILFGTDTTGVVTGTELYYPKRGTNYVVKFEYQTGGKTETGSDEVSQADYELLKALKVPRPEVPIRHFSLGPLKAAMLRDRDSYWRKMGPVTLFVGFWDAAMGMIVYMIWIKPLRVRRLYKYGQETPGIVTKKRVQKGKSLAYYISYIYRDPITGESIRKESQVYDQGRWSSAWVGQPVTVLYAVRNPKRSTTYEYGGYKVKSPSGTIQPQSSMFG